MKIANKWFFFLLSLKANVKIIGKDFHGNLYKEIDIKWKSRRWVEYAKDVENPKLVSPEWNLWLRSVISEPPK